MRRRALPSRWTDTRTSSSKVTTWDDALTHVGQCVDGRRESTEGYVLRVASCSRGNFPARSFLSSLAIAPRSVASDADIFQGVRCKIGKRSILMPRVLVID